ncbi:hypothetical protein [Vagococcus intermedius]|uniref:Uncharacterized protein n=1 Tax=Vagococcus intermedius TaxID=2991418 RepID=A0AAF0I8B7_9ENTE|nr:hypothetical protein [Vagococcus intermedius]WEG74235.1 hypothetical protein OL234_04885 [Vagococcus intermedius]WEG76317.1 hypothetical protein OL235_04890 [Vagococcus intermedius]
MDILELNNFVEGTWHNGRPKEKVLVDHFAIDYDKIRTDKKTLFFAMDKETWLRGTKNTGVYAKW